MLMRPDFNRLRLFFHVRAEGSVSRAAAALHVTQSAVSQGLAKLEEELGAQLFVRKHRAVVPTAAGEALFAIVAPFVAALQAGLADIQRARHELAGTLRLGAPAEFGAHLLPALLAGFGRANPGVRFTLQLGHPTLLVPLLEEGRLDLAFADVFDARMAGLDVVDVMDETLTLVGTANLERRLAGSRAFARLSALPFVDYHPGAPAVRGWFRHHFGRVPPRLDVVLAVESVQAVLAAAEQGMGLAVVPAHAAARALAEGRLIAITTRRRALRHRISLLRVLDRVPSKLEKAFAAFALAELGRARGDAPARSS
jgi:DNA-binding transcriptional LysR family regulator